VNAAWQTCSTIQDEINRLRDTQFYCERRILELQSGMTVIAEVASLQDEPAFVPQPAPPPSTPPPFSKPVHYRRWRNAPTRTAQLISIIEGRMNGEPWTVQMFMQALRDENGSLPRSMGMNLPARLTELCREGFLTRVKRGQYAKFAAQREHEPQGFNVEHGATAKPNASVCTTQ
jgi:hypothetical protein